MAKHKHEEHPEDVEVKETVETAEQAESASPEKSELELANERADDFENKYLRAHAEMQNIQRRANEERQLLQRYRSQDLAKAILPSLDNLERALAVEGLTDDVKKGLVSQVTSVCRLFFCLICSSPQTDRDRKSVV